MAKKMITIEFNSHVFYLPQKLENIVLELCNNFSDNNLNIKQLCLKHVISYSHLYDEFISYLQITPSAFLENIRLEFAISLLDDELCLIKELSVKAGFKHQRTFRNVFKRKLGHCPFDCRENITSNKNKETSKKELSQKIWC